MENGWTTFSDHYCANLSYKLFIRSFVINKLASIEIDHQKNSLSIQMHEAEGWREGKWRTIRNKKTYGKKEALTHLEVEANRTYIQMFTFIEVWKLNNIGIEKMKLRINEI